MKSTFRMTVLTVVSVLTACGGGGTDAPSGGGSPTPTVSLSASPISITTGSSSTLTWSSTNATACTATGGWSGAKAVSGSESTGVLTANAAYTLSCSGAGGSAQASVAVSISGSTPAPAITLTASPSSVSAGGSSTLAWSTTNATSCTASGSWSGGKATSGTQSTGALNANASYTLSCTGAGGSAQASASVNVGGSSTAPTVTLSASPLVVASGASSTLTWSSSNVTSCTASGGWSGAKATSGSQSTGPLTTVGSFTLSCSGAGGTAVSTVIVNIATSSSTFPLHVAPGGRYLMDAQNHPFLIQGDSPWSLIAQLSKADADTYLETRRQQGFNTVMTNLIEHHFADNPPKNADGQAPFANVNDFTTHNDAYFAHAQYVVAKAREKGMLVLLAPAYMGYQGGDEGWYAEMTASGATKLRAYGQYVATQFAAYDNIIWVQGGDYDPPDKTLARAIANGIRDVDTNGRWLQTFHGGRGTGALEFLNTTSDPWLGVNNVYTDAGTVVSEAFGQYAGSTMPFFLIEAGYENHDVDAAGVRTQAYQAVLSGAMGQMMGNFPVWYFGAGWQTALNSAGATTVGHLPELFLSTGIPWETLQPDTNGTVLRSAPGSGANRAVAARTSNGNAVLAFTPVSQTLTIDMTKLTGPNVAARWFDPATGTLSAVSESPFTNTGSRSFAAPAGHDSVLVLQSQP